MVSHYTKIREEIIKQKKTKKNCDLVNKKSKIHQKKKKKQVPTIRSSKYYNVTNCHNS